MVSHSRLRRVDAAIIGNELTGDLLGAALAAAGMRVVRIELQGRLTEPAQQPATLLHAPMLSTIQRIHGTDTARFYAAELQEQLLALTSASLPYVQRLPAYAFARTAKESALLEQNQTLLARLHLPASMTTDTGGCPFPARQALLMLNQAVVHVDLWRKTLQRSILRQGGRVFTDIQRLEMDGRQLLIEHGRIQAQHVILTTGMPLGLASRALLSMLEVRLLIACNLHAPWPLSSLQQSVDGNLHLLPSPTGATALWHAGRIGASALHRQCSSMPQFLSAWLPEWKPGAMSYHMGVFPIDGLPFMGMLPHTKVFFACGTNACPILGAMHAADTLARRILGKAKPEDRIFEPDRAIPPSLRPKARLQNIRRYATAALHPQRPSCPHCGCKLRYFEPHQHWGCICCGSAYTAFGQPIYGPTMQAARIRASHRPL